MRYNYVIIEDEKGAFKNLQNALKKHNNYCFVGHSTNIEDGISCIIEKKPHLLFLDIELAEENSFDLVTELRKLYHQLPPIIVTTAHSNYAIDAVNNDVLYFIQKPINALELQKALSRFEQKHLETSKQLKIKTSPDTHFLDYDKIAYIEASDNYSNFIKNDGTSLLSSKNLGFYEPLLPTNFVKIHRKFIININYLLRYVPRNNEVVLEVNSIEKPLKIGKTHLKKIAILANEG
ncbi:MAG: LytTR family DNA-binding domain-containing protein [Flavobacteriales bacterium]|jgi:two-component system LytT family response regulator|nr:LytTR family DNA-binding domain-containing protein [Flavobacteriales bacterium]